SSFCLPCASPDCPWLYFLRRFPGEKADLAVVVSNLCPNAERLLQSQNEAFRIRRQKTAAELHLGDGGIGDRDFALVVSVEFLNCIVECFALKIKVSQRPLELSIDVFLWNAAHHN